jgi:hypothetical protein
MHMYITSALQKTDMKAVGLQLALELLHEKVKRQSHKKKIDCLIKLFISSKYPLLYIIMLQIILQFFLNIIKATLFLKIICLV